jgi:hypothetical protein
VLPDDRVQIQNNPPGDKDDDEFWADAESLRYWMFDEATDITPIDSIKRFLRKYDAERAALQTDSDAAFRRHVVVEIFAQWLVAMVRDYPVDVPPSSWRR